MEALTKLLFSNFHTPLSRIYCTCEMSAIIGVLAFDKRLRY